MKEPTNVKFVATIETMDFATEFPIKIARTFDFADAAQNWLRRKMVAAKSHRDGCYSSTPQIGEQVGWGFRVYSLKTLDYDAASKMMMVRFPRQSVYFERDDSPSEKTTCAICSTENTKQWYKLKCKDYRHDFYTLCSYCAEFCSSKMYTSRDNEKSEETEM